MMAFYMFCLFMGGVILTLAFTLWFPLPLRRSNHELGKRFEALCRDLSDAGLVVVISLDRPRVYVRHKEDVSAAEYSYTSVAIVENDPPLFYVKPSNTSMEHPEDEGSQRCPQRFFSLSQLS